MRKFLHIAAAAGLLLALPEQPALAQDCRPTNLAPFSRLGKAVAAARANEPSQLLAAWLLQPRAGGDCRFVFRVDLLMQNGQVHSMNFDAQTLEPVDIANERDWMEAGADAAGSSGGGGASEKGASSSSDDDRDDDDDDRDDDDRDDDNSGRGHGGDDSGGDDSGGDDSGGDDSSGSGGGGNSGPGGGGGSGSGSGGSGGGDD